MTSPTGESEKIEDVVTQAVFPCFSWPNLILFSHISITRVSLEMSRELRSQLTFDGMSDCDAFVANPFVRFVLASLFSHLSHFEKE